MGDMREIRPDPEGLEVRPDDLEDLKILKAQIAVDGSFANGVRFGIEMALRILRLEGNVQCTL